MYKAVNVSPTENDIENLVKNFNRIVYVAADQSLKKKNGTGKRKINNKSYAPFVSVWKYMQI
jgi:hypothetical protein